MTFSPPYWYTRPRAVSIAAPLASSISGSPEAHPRLGVCHHDEKGLLNPWYLNFCGENVTSLWELIVVN